MRRTRNPVQPFRLTWVRIPPSPPGRCFGTSWSVSNRPCFLFAPGRRPEACPRTSRGIHSHQKSLLGSWWGTDAEDTQGADRAGGRAAEAVGLHMVGSSPNARSWPGAYPRGQPRRSEGGCTGCQGRRSAGTRSDCRSAGGPQRSRGRSSGFEDLCRMRRRSRGGATSSTGRSGGRRWPPTPTGHREPARPGHQATNAATGTPGSPARASAAGSTHACRSAAPRRCLAS